MYCDDKNITAMLDVMSAISRDTLPLFHLYNWCEVAAQHRESCHPQHCHDKFSCWPSQHSEPLHSVVTADNKVLICDFLLAINKCSPTTLPIIDTIYLAEILLIDKLKRVNVHCLLSMLQISRLGDNKESYCQFYIHKSFTTFP